MAKQAEKISIQSIVVDKTIYPRKHMEKGLVAEYIELLKSGGSFKERIVLEEGTNRVLDGIHRLEAFKEIGATEIEIVFHKIPDGMPPIVYAAFLNSQHGLRLEKNEKKEVARAAIKANPLYDLKALSEALSVSLRSVEIWTEDLRAQLHMSDNIKILQLNMLGWTNEMIGDSYDLDESTIRKRFEGEIADLRKLLESRLKLKNPADLRTDAETPTPEVLAWALKLNDEKDPSKMELLDISIRPYDVWNFSGADSRFGLDDYPGRIPAELVAHALFYYTEPGDLVLDPMAGGGTVSDVALAMGRKCLSYDVQPRKERIDIIPWDIKNGLPQKPKGRDAELIFLDPPYFRKKDYGKDSISALSKEEYLAIFTQIAKDAKEKWLTDSGKIALLMSDFTPAFDSKEKDTIWIWEYVAILEKKGFKPLRRIQCPLTSQQLHPADQKNFPKEKKMGRLGRDLIVFGWAK